MLITLLVGVIVIAIVLWLVGMLPLDARAHQIIRVIIALIGLIWLLGVATGKHYLGF
jgi:hypothetical protein